MPRRRPPGPPPEPEIPEAERIEQLRLAIAAVEQLLPPAGPEPTLDWPDRTDQLGAAVTDVRRLAATFKHDEAARTWPRTPCVRCNGKGWYWDDPDINPRGWNPCRYCITTGVALRPDRWNPASATVHVHEPYGR